MIKYVYILKRFRCGRDEMKRYQSLLKVLIVDDELTVRQGIKHLFDWEQEGFIIVGEAANGNEALNQIKTLKPQVVITDIVMPMMDGAKLTEAIKEHDPEIQVIILSSHADFNYVRSTFRLGVSDYILKPTLEAHHLLSILKKVKEQILLQTHQEIRVDHNLIAQSIIESLIQGYQVNPLKLKEIFLYPDYVVISAKRDGAKPKAFEELMLKLEEIEKFSQVKKNIYTYFEEVNLAFWIINSEEAALTDILLEIEQFVLAKKSLTLFISRIFHHGEELNKICLEEIPKLVNKSFFNPELKVYTQSKTLKKPLARQPFNFEAFSDGFRSYQYSRVFSSLLDYIKVGVVQADWEPSEYRAFLIKSIFNISLEVNLLFKGKTSIDKEKYDYFQKINQIEFAYEGIQFIQDFIDQISLSLPKENKKQENIDLIVDYIQKNYDKPLSLKTVSDQFHFNASYLSTYFSNYYPEGFNEYLNKLRVEEAARRLRMTQNSISEIGLSVGYSDHSYFCKVFKKIMAVSPGQYRKSVGE